MRISSESARIVEDWTLDITEELKSLKAFLDARGALEHFGPSAPKFDAVILDLRLPDSADLGLLQRIRNESAYDSVRDSFLEFTGVVQAERGGILFAKIFSG